MKIHNKNILKPPLFDLTVINGVESIFHKPDLDPWAIELAGRFADFFIYSDNGRYMLPVPSIKDPIFPEVPELLATLIKRDSNIFMPEKYDTSEKRILAEEYLIPQFEYFDIWARNNPGKLRLWLKAHHEPWLKKGHLTRVKKNYVFSVENIKSKPIFQKHVGHLKVTEAQILYAFDVVLRYPVYGEFAGEQTHYLAHPIREEQSFSTMERNPGLPPNIPLSFSHSISSFVKNLTLNDYTVLLHELRGIIRDKRIHLLKHGEVEPSVRREIAEKVLLPSRLKELTRILGLTAGVVGGASAFTLAVPLTVAGGAIAVASALWTRTLPRSTAKYKWLRWAIEYDIEKETRSK